MQIDSGATDAVAPKEIAKALKMKETPMPKKGVGRVAATGATSRTWGRSEVWDTQMLEMVWKMRISMRTSRRFRGQPTKNARGVVVV